MSNEASDYLKARITFAQKELKSVIQLYDTMNDDVRMSNSKKIFYEILGYIQIQSVIIFPLMEKDTTTVESITRSKELHESIRDTIEKATMLHVDEPDHEYLNRLRALDLLVNSLVEHDQGTLVQWMDAHLTVEDVARLMPRLKENAMQEALPSF
jgi:hypothetical protein